MPHYMLYHNSDRRVNRPVWNQALKHSEASIISSFNRALLSVMRSFAELNVRSHSGLIAGMDKISKAMRANDGYWASYRAQNATKSTALSASSPAWSRKNSVLRYLSSSSSFSLGPVRLYLLRETHWSKSESPFFGVVKQKTRKWSDNDGWKKRETRRLSLDSRLLCSSLMVVCGCMAV